MDFQTIARACQAPYPIKSLAPKRRDAKPTAAIAADRFQRTKALPQMAMSPQVRDKLAAPLIDKMRQLDWETQYGEKIKLMGALSQLGSDLGATAMIAEYKAGIGQISPARQMVLARTFQPLLSAAHGADSDRMSSSARDEVVAFLSDEFANGHRSIEVRQQLGYALALSRTDAGADALIKAYQALPDRVIPWSDKVMGMMAYCSTQKMATFLVEEYGRQTGNEDRRVKLLDTLQQVLGGPTS